VFFTGSGGTGKTHVLKQILRFFKQKYSKYHSDFLYMGHACECFQCNVAVTAPTGIAGEVWEPAVSIMFSSFGIWFSLFQCTRADFEVILFFSGFIILESLVASF